MDESGKIIGFSSGSSIITGNQTVWQTAIVRAQDSAWIGDVNSTIVNSGPTVLNETYIEELSTGDTITLFDGPDSSCPIVCTNGTLNIAASIPNNTLENITVTGPAVFNGPVSFGPTVSDVIVQAGRQLTTLGTAYFGDIVTFDNNVTFNGCVGDLLVKTITGCDANLNIGASSNINLLSPLVTFSGETISGTPSRSGCVYNGAATFSGTVSNEATPFQLNPTAATCGSIDFVAIGNATLGAFLWERGNYISLIMDGSFSAPTAASYGSLRAWITLSDGNFYGGEIGGWINVQAFVLPAGGTARFYLYNVGPLDILLPGFNPPQHTQRWVLAWEYVKYY
ncbi:MAG: hypothetical protein HC888_02210 [Candidatus Competibacteraceae bacterium]|nr:hypothetical protein [Candidatus Competibacteraceae bacterium]